MKFLEKSIGVNAGNLQNLMNQAFGGNTNTGTGFGNNGLSLDDKDLTAIQGLVSLGFDYNQCVEAYLSCGKNEDMAANFLFENPNFGKD